MQNMIHIPYWDENRCLYESENYYFYKLKYIVIRLNIKHTKRIRFFRFRTHVDIIKLFCAPFSGFKILKIYAEHRIPIVARYFRYHVFHFALRIRNIVRNSNRISKTFQHKNANNYSRMR